MPLHSRKWIVASMSSDAVKIREILQLGQMPIESLASKRQAADAGTHRLRRGEALFELTRVIEEMTTG